MTTCKECVKAVAAEAPTCPHCGTAEPGEGGAERDAARKAETKAFERKLSMGCGGFVLAVVLLVGVASLVGGDDEGEDEGGNGNGGAALTSCKSAVTAQLANPATADFETLATTMTETAAGFTISGPMKAQNGFGVEQELRYRCTTTPGGTILTATVG